MRAPKKNYRQKQIDSLSGWSRSRLVVLAGEDVLRQFVDGECRLCNYSDHDDDGTERHEDECPLRVLD